MRMSTENTKVKNLYVFLIYYKTLAMFTTKKI